MALTFKSLKDYEAWKAQARARYGTPEPEPEQASEPEAESSEPEASPPAPVSPPAIITPKRVVSPVTRKRQAPPESKWIPFWLEAAIIAVATLVSAHYWR